MPDEEKKNPFFNIGLTIVVGAILWWALGTGAAISLTFTKLPDIFWIAVVLIILFVIIRKFKWGQKWTKEKNKRKRNQSKSRW